MKPCYVDSLFADGRPVVNPFVPEGPPASTSRAHVRCIFGGVQRQCSRSGCAEPAVITLTYQYARSAVWLDDLSAERDPHAYDLCRRHGSRLSVPHGWRLEDRRTVLEFVLAATG